MTEWNGVIQDSGVRYYNLEWVGVTWHMATASGFWGILLHSSPPQPPPPGNRFKSECSEIIILFFADFYPELVIVVNKKELLYLKISASTCKHLGSTTNQSNLAKTGFIVVQIKGP